MRANPLRDWRHKNGLKALDVALRLDVSEQTITSYEKGRFQPSAESFEKLSELLGVEVSTLRAAWHFWRVSAAREH